MTVAGAIIETPGHTTRPVWVWILERFGLPSALVILFLWKGLGWIEEDRRDRREILARLATAIESQTTTLERLAIEHRELNDTVRATWPPVRPPRRVPP